MRHLVIGQRQKTPNFSAFHWSPHGCLITIGQHFVTTRVVHLPKRTETNLITESDQSRANHQLLQLCTVRTALSNLDQAVRAVHSCKSWFLNLSWFICVYLFIDWLRYFHADQSIHNPLHLPTYVIRTLRIREVMSFRKVEFSKSYFKSCTCSCRRLQKPSRCTKSVSNRVILLHNTRLPFSFWSYKHFDQTPFTLYCGLFGQSVCNNYSISGVNIFFWTIALLHVHLVHAAFLKISLVCRICKWPNRCFQIHIYP